MKPNIDLTENRDFNERSDSASFLDKFFGKKFPWGFIKEPNLKSNGLLQTGYVSEIKNNKMWNKLDNREMCEKCGKDNSNTKWDMIYGLCSKCEGLVVYCSRCDMTGYWGNSFSVKLESKKGDE